MNKATFYAKSFCRRSSKFTKFFGRVVCRVIWQIQLFQDNIHNRRNPYRHCLQQRLWLAVQYRVVGTNFARNEFFQNVRHFETVRKKFFKLGIVRQFESISRTDSNVRLSNYRITNFSYKNFRGVKRRDFMQSSSLNTRKRVISFHRRLAFYAADIFNFLARRNVKICPKTGVLFKPILVVRFQPIHLAVFETEKRHRLKHRVIIFQRRQVVIFRQCRLEFPAQIIKRRVAYSQHVHAISFQAVAEFPIMLRKLRRDKD